MGGGGGGGALSKFFGKFLVLSRKLRAKMMSKLRTFAGDFESNYHILLDEVNCVSLYNRRIHNMLIFTLQQFVSD